MIRLIPLPDIDYVWPFIAEGMERACEKAGSNDNHMVFYQMCRGNEAFLHVVTEGEGIVGAIITQVRSGRQGPFIKVVAMCGKEMDGWLAALVADPFWKMTGATRVRFEGRVGLMRIPGAKVIRQVYEMELPHGG